MVLSDSMKFGRLLYIFYKGHCALYGDERFYNLFNFKMVSSTNFLLRWFDSSRRLKGYTKINKKGKYNIDSIRGQ
nr:MAG TPA: hypothetical protein [Caudoviricetes sp.]